jgi:hypothetical protein
MSIAEEPASNCLTAPSGKVILIGLFILSAKIGILKWENQKVGEVRGKFEVRNTRRKFEVRNTRRKLEVRNTKYEETWKLEVRNTKYEE